MNNWGSWVPKIPEPSFSYTTTEDDEEYAAVFNQLEIVERLFAIKDERNFSHSSVFGDVDPEEILQNITKFVHKKSVESVA